MKEYKQNVLKNISLPADQLAALDFMSPSIPVTLDYLIGILDRGITRNNDRADTITKWKNTKKLLETVRGMYL